VFTKGTMTTDGQTVSTLELLLDTGFVDVLHTGSHRDGWEIWVD
jgi:hypothetical protein